MFKSIHAGRALSVFLLLSVCFCLASCTTTAKKTGKEELHCTVSISCESLVGNAGLDPNKTDFVPTGGLILPQTQIAFSENETVYDVLLRACAQHVCVDNCAYCRNGGIQIESAYTPGYGTYYVEGIHQIYEKDCGAQSGWLFTVNGEMAAKGCSEIPVCDGDRIEWVYTTDWNDMT